MGIMGDRWVLSWLPGSLLHCSTDNQAAQERGEGGLKCRSKKDGHALIARYVAESILIKRITRR